jgi:hypothetical protein
MPSGNGDTTVYAGNSFIDLLIGANVPANAKFVQTYCPHSANCIINNFFDQLVMESGDSCWTGAGGVFGAPNHLILSGRLIWGLWSAILLLVGSAAHRISVIEHLISNS